MLSERVRLALAALALALGLAGCAHRRPATLPPRPLSSEERAMVAEVGDVEALRADEGLARRVGLAFDDYWESLGARLIAVSGAQAAVVVVEVDELGAAGWDEMPADDRRRLVEDVLTFLMRSEPDKGVALIIAVPTHRPAAAAIYLPAGRQLVYKNI